jgi:serine/threonine protein kinase
MLLDHPYDSSVDWWQLGIATYQMLTGLSPFRGEDEDEIYDSILLDEPLIPYFMKNWTLTIDFVQCLLRKEPGKRLGSGTNGADQVMGHEFFSGILWDDLYHKRVAAPFIPAVVTGNGLALTSDLDSELTPQRTNMPARIAATEGIRLRITLLVRYFY